MIKKYLLTKYYLFIAPALLNTESNTPPEKNSFELRNFRAMGYIISIAFGVEQL
jgi:hypothetical protein